MGTSQSTLKYPLSGAVNQAFDFMNSWFRAVGSQVGLVNITVGSTANPEAEKEILEDVGTYGRQLGRLGDALRVLVDQVDQSKLSPEKKKAIGDILNTFGTARTDTIATHALGWGGGIGPVGMLWGVFPSSAGAPDMAR